VCDEVIREAVGDFGVEAGGGTYYVDASVGVEAFEDATGCYL
jgi:hypothetical protein